MKKSKILLIAAIIGTICLVIIIASLGDYLNGINNADAGTQIGTMIGTVLVMPSTIISAIGLIFAWVGFGTSKRSFALTSGILYAVAIVLMLPWFMFNIVQMILSFVAYGTMGKVKGNGETEKTE
ncbi:MAG: hypothetical protein J6Y60_03465 [Treponema sp.]|nr:hypothetical protein [Treponema sp.]